MGAFPVSMIGEILDASSRDGGNRAVHRIVHDGEGGTFEQGTHLNAIKRK